MNDLAALRKSLCTAFCEDVVISERGDLLTVSIPLTARDGDCFTAYLSRKNGGWRVSDAANTMMRLSYENDLAKLLTGPRAKLYETILAESGLFEDNGEIYIDVPADKLSRGIFALGQGLSRIEDIALWTKSRVGSTFTHDLRELLNGFVPKEIIEEGYVPEIYGGDDYAVDFRIETEGKPVFLFGVNGRDKARLTTITLLHLKQVGVKFDSIIVCNDFYELPKKDASRLMSAANDVVPSILDTASIIEKVRHRMV